MKDIKQSLVDIEADLKGKVANINRRDSQGGFENPSRGLGIGPTEGLSHDQVS